MKSRIVLALGSLFWSACALAQRADDAILNSEVPKGEGWYGFTDLEFLLNAFFTLGLAAVLGAVIGYHPKAVQTADTLKEIEAPKVDIMYAVIGALIGIMVVKYGLVIGFVLFGIGGLIRFRTVMRSANLTGQVILVTLVGLSCGLDLPHVAVLATAFGWVLIFLLEKRITYRLDIRALPEARFAEAAEAYRDVLEHHGCEVLGEKKNPDIGRLRLIFKSARHDTREKIEELLDERVNPELRGSVDWEID